MRDEQCTLHCTSTVYPLDRPIGVRVASIDYTSTSHDTYPLRIVLQHVLDWSTFPAPRESMRHLHAIAVGPAVGPAVDAAREDMGRRAARSGVRSSARRHPKAR